MPKTNVVKLNKSKRVEKKPKSVETVSANLREPSTATSAAETTRERSPAECVLFGLYKLNERIWQADSALTSIVSKYGIKAESDRDVRELSIRLDMMRDEERYIRESFLATTAKSPEEHVLRQIARAHHVIKAALFSGQSKTIAAAAEVAEEILVRLVDEVETPAPDRSAEVERCKKLRRVIADVNSQLDRIQHNVGNIELECDESRAAHDELSTVIGTLNQAEIELDETIKYIDPLDDFPG